MKAEDQSPCRIRQKVNSSKSSLTNIYHLLQPIRILIRLKLILLYPRLEIIFSLDVQHKFLPTTIMLFYTIFSHLQKKQETESLKELRNKMAFGYFLLNGIFVVFIFTMQVNSSQVRVFKSHHHTASAYAKTQRPNSQKYE